MFTWLLKKLIGSKHDRTVKRLRPLVAEINVIESSYADLDDDQLRAKTDEFRQRHQDGESLDDLLPEAFAAVKNACRRLCGTEIDIAGQAIVWDMVPYDVQLIGGIALHKGNIAEMQTGEGKTLVAVLPLYLNALTGRNCQLVTVNDYLARRDSQWVGAVLRWLGLTVGCIQHDMSPAERREAYACDITYGTNSEFGFDYLRDMGMAMDPEDMVQRDYYYVIVDEIDSILVDEARTPLIISGPSAVSTHKFDQFKPTVEALYRKQHQLCTRLINEAREVLAQDEADDDAREDAYLKALKVKLGMPKHKQFMRLMEDPVNIRRLEKLEGSMRSDQNRGAFQSLKGDLYFTIDERANDTDLSEMGRTELRPNDPDVFLLPDLADEFQAIDGDSSLSDDERRKRKEERQRLFEERSESIHNISQLLRAYCVFERDVHYVVQENKVIIVDEQTGRPMPGRRFSEGLHQALEAKEDVEIERETQTLATVTIQNYFRMYDKLAGMTGTAETEASEFREIYALDVVVVPTNRPNARADENDRIYKTKREKYAAIVHEVRERHDRGQPVLLGTVSVEVSEILSRMLKREKITHNVLNAKQHQAEADVVSRAGQRGAVTVATNMAGRGTDIRLGPGVKELGGLHVIGSERHDSRRIDRQLRGRCARQGDPGSSRFYISLEDNLMRLFGSDRIARLMEKFGLEDGEELSHPLLNRSVEGAQRKVEQQHFSYRKRTLQFDDVMNKQREVIYGRRRDILRCDSPREMMFAFVEDAIWGRLDQNLVNVKDSPDGMPLNRDAVLHWLNTTLPITFTEDDLQVDHRQFDAEPIIAHLMSRIDDIYKAKEKGEDLERLRRIERHIMLTAHDRQWQEHLYAMDSLREGIFLVGHAQRDPIVEYKSSAFDMFGELLGQIDDEIAGTMFRSATSLNAFQQFLAGLPQQEVHRVLAQFDIAPPERMTTTSGTGTGDDPEAAAAPAPKQAPYHREQPKVGRNDPCPCESGKKFKHCHGRKV